MAQATDKLILEIIADNKQAVKSILEIQDKTGEMTKKSAGFLDGFKKNWLAVTGAVVGVIATMKKAFDLSREYAEYKEGLTALANNTGMNGDRIVETLNKMSRGMISNRDLMLNANRSIAMGVTEDVGTMGKLYEVARVKAVQMGISTQQAYDMIIDGIGKTAPRVLAGVGFMSKSWDEEAKAKGVSYDKQFMLNKVLQEGAEQIRISGTYTESTADKINKMNVSWANMQLRLGEVIAPLVSGIADAVSAYLDFGKKLDEVIAKALWTMGNFGYRVRAILASILDPKQKDAWSKFFEERDKVYDNWIKGLEEKNKKAQKNMPGAGETNEQLMARLKSMEEYYAYIGDLRNADLVKAEEQYNTLRMVHEGNYAQMSEIDEQYLNNKELIEAQYAELERARNEIAVMEYGRLYEDLTAKHRAEVDKRAKAEGDLASQIKKTAKDAAESVFKDYSQGMAHAIVTGEIFHKTLGDFFKDLGNKIAEMTLELIIFKGMMAGLNLITGGLFGAIFGSGGGVVPGYRTGGTVYAAGGWPAARGTDTVPAMLTPGERILSVQQNGIFENFVRAFAPIMSMARVSGYAQAGGVIGAGAGGGTYVFNITGRVIDKLAFDSFVKDITKRQFLLEGEV